MHLLKEVSFHKKTPVFEAAILMGGFGTRLQSISRGVPKPMMVVNGEPFVYILMRNLAASGCSKIYLSTHYQAAAIEKQIIADDPVDCDLVFVPEEEPMGTGGALKLVAKRMASENFIAMNGDTYSNLDLKDFFNKNKHEEFAIAGLSVRDSARYGALEIDRSNRLLGIREKSAKGPGIINSGTYLVSRQSLLEMKMEKFSFEKDYIDSVGRNAAVHVFEGDFIDIGVPEDYFFACGYFS